MPRERLVVITGLSGSGKSSLAFDTIYAEGQRRYVESLSAYARQFLEQMEKPDVDLIEGLSPAISIEQKTTASNPRSTVGTVTEIYDYLRLLFANIGVPHCPNCGREIASQSLERIIDLVMTLPAGRAHQRAGADRARSQGRVQEGARGAPDARLLEGAHRRPLPFARRRHQARSPEEPHDRSRRRPARSCARGIERRLTESIETALQLANEIVVINGLDEGDRLFSRRMACVNCGISVPELSPRAFSFNSPHGACPECQGLGADLGLRPGAHRPRPVEVAGRGRDRAVGPRRQEARGRRAGDAVGDVRHRPGHAVREAAEEAARPAALRAGRRRRGARAPRRSGRPSRLAATSKASCPTCAAATTRRRGRCRKRWSRIARCGLPGVRGRAPEAGKPRGPREGPPDCRVREPADRRGAARLRDAGAVRSRVDHRRPHPARRSRIGCAS